jgi:thiol-disulfide isomerase/thioredoxin
VLPARRARQRARARSRSRAALLALALASFCAPGTLFAAHDWNDAAIAWVPIDKGLEAAKSQGRPICLVIYTEWCPHCANYARVFHDPKVVESAARFVMVRVDKDKNPEVSARYAVDGQYIPRTYFLGPGGTVETAIHAPREKFLYFYDEKDPASLLAGMRAALEGVEGNRPAEGGSRPPKEGASRDASAHPVAPAAGTPPAPAAPPAPGPPSGKPAPEPAPR